MKARIAIHRDFKIGTIDNRIYGAFLEHLGRAVYGGIYEPGHATADEDGFRGDVLELVRGLERAGRALSRRQFRLRTTTGWTASGPRISGRCGSTMPGRPARPTRSAPTSSSAGAARPAPSRCWPSISAREGFDRSARHARILQPSRRQLLERPAHARTARRSPHDVKVWCLGNEMDGPWQMDHRTGYEYGRIANEVGARHEGVRHDARARRLRLVARQHADLSRLGGRGARRVLRQRRLHLASQLLGQLGRRLPELPRQVRVAGPLHPAPSAASSTTSRPRSARSRTSTSPSTSGTSGITAASRASATATASTGRRRRACSKTSTISRTCCWSAAPSTPSSAAPTG